MKQYYKIIDEKEVLFTGNVLYTEKEIDGVKYKMSIYNPTDQDMIDAGWLEWTPPEPAAAEKLRAAKEEKIQQIENYDSSDAVEQFTINGTPMWLSHEVRQQVKTSVEAYVATGAEECTKIFNGVEYTFPCATWLQMLSALEVYAAEALNTTERHKLAVSKLTSVKKVRDYVYTEGYPEKLNFGE